MKAGEQTTEDDWMNNFVQQEAKFHPKFVKARQNRRTEKCRSQDEHRNRRRPKTDFSATGEPRPNCNKPENHDEHQPKATVRRPPDLLMSFEKFVCIGCHWPDRIYDFSNTWRGNPTLER